MSFAINFECLKNTQHANNISTVQCCHGCNRCNDIQNKTQNVAQQQPINPYNAAKEFCNLYYGGMTSKGCNGVLYLFDQNAHCNYNGKELIGFYNVMTIMATEGVSKTAYDKLSCTVLPINNDQISLTVTGYIQGITYWGQYTGIYLFTETFILTLRGQTIGVTSYSTKLI